MSDSKRYCSALAGEWFPASVRKGSRTLLGALRQGDKGLYVSTGSFSKEAHYEAERANVPVTLIDLDSLVDLLTSHYESLDAETRALIPLKKFYWPAG